MTATPPPESNPPWRLLDLAIIALVFSIFLLRGTPTYVEPDIWGHLKQGLDMWHTGALTPEVDPYSYTNADYRVINHEWLAQVIFGGLYLLAGPQALIAWKLVLGLGLLGLLYRQLLRDGLDALRAGALMLVVFYIFLPILGTLAVGLYSYLFFAVLLLLLRATDDGSRVAPWLIPPLIALWFNLHPGVIAGVGVVVVWSAVHLALALRPLGAPGASWRVAALVGGGTLLATCVNPYGPALPLLLLDRGTGARPELTEFLPIHITSGEGIAYLLLLTVAVVGLLGSTRPLCLPQLAVLFCTALTPLMATRHTILCATAVVILSGEHIASAAARWLPSGGASSRLDRIFAWACLLVALGFAVLSLPGWRCVQLAPEKGQPFPCRAVALLNDSGVRGNIVAFFDWGEYVMWHLGPEMKVAIDGRREVAHSAALYELNFQFLRGAPAASAVLSIGPADLVLMHRNFPAFDLMKLEPGWEAVYEDPLCGLFARRGSTMAAQLRATPPRPEVPIDGAGRCFPDELK